MQTFLVKTLKTN